MDDTNESRWGLSRRSIPFVLFLVSLFKALGSGATVKFFPLFFKDAGMTTMQVQLVAVLQPLAITAFIWTAKLLADRFGRIQVVVAAELAGESCLLLMAAFKTAGPFVLVPIFLVRSALMNCGYPLVESVLMDVVPSNERARWKSLESVAALGWTGSALAGGALADRHGYGFTFVVTAAMQFAATLLTMPLASVVPMEKRGSVGGGESGSGGDGVAATGSSRRSDDDGP